MHTMAAKYPEQPSKDQQCDMKSFFNIFSKFYPCEPCAKDFQEELVNVAQFIRMYPIYFITKKKQLINM